MSLLTKATVSSVSLRDQFSYVNSGASVGLAPREHGQPTSREDSVAILRAAVDANRRAPRRLTRARTQLLEHRQHLSFDHLTGLPVRLARYARVTPPST